MYSSIRSLFPLISLSLMFSFSPGSTALIQDHIQTRWWCLHALLLHYIYECALVSYSKLREHTRLPGTPDYGLPKNLDETAANSLSPLPHLHSQSNSSQSHLHYSLLAPSTTTDTQAQQSIEQRLCAEWRQDAMAPEVSGRHPSSHICLQNACSRPGKDMTFIQEDSSWVEMAVTDAHTFFWYW